MLITLTQYRDLAVSPNGVAMPMGRSCSGFEALTEDGAAAAMADGTAIVRVATDTPVQVDVGIAESSGELLPGGTVEWFAVAPGQVLTFAAVEAEAE